MEELVVRYAHFIGIMMLSSMLVAENIMIAKHLESSSIKRLVIIDGLYGFAAVLTLGAGLMLWLSVGKPKEFYTANMIFHIKLTLFVLVALISAIPTFFLIKNRKADSISVPGYIILIKRIELALIAVIPMLAVLMARGVGLE